jgi:hypothetical protein
MAPTPGTKAKLRLKKSALAFWEDHFYGPKKRGF